MFLISFDYTGAVKWRFGISWFFSFRFRFPLEAYTACGHPVFKKLNIRSTQVILPRPAATPSKGGDGSERQYSLPNHNLLNVNFLGVQDTVSEGFFFGSMAEMWPCFIIKHKTLQVLYLPEGFEVVTGVPRFYLNFVAEVNTPSFTKATLYPLTVVNP